MTTWFRLSTVLKFMETGITSFDLEKYLTTYKTVDGFDVYNLSLAIHIDIDTINDSLFDFYHVRQGDAWTTISFRFYNTIKLWWLVVKCNADVVENPLIMPASGTKIRIAKPVLVQNILSALNNQ